VKDNFWRCSCLNLCVLICHLFVLNCGDSVIRYINMREFGEINDFLKNG
jgi:hypothetical protein